MITTFPGGTSLTGLDVYRDAAPDGICGGSPHVHLASTEAYLVVSGRGALHTIDRDGYRETPLEAGSVVWFTPGTVHRAVNEGDLRVIVLMSNVGLPEAGDAVLTFPADIVADAEAYAAASALGDADGRELRASARRDLAVAGFETLRDAVVSGDRTPLEAFYAAAVERVRSRAQDWPALVVDGPLAQAERAVALAEAIAGGSVEHLGEARLSRAEASAGEPAYGMCGRLRTYDITTPTELQESPQ
ncbi:cupin domain-containing protein [Microbacterium sp. GXF0217]